jgi:hypothetical protein
MKRNLNEKRVKIKPIINHQFKKKGFEAINFETLWK